MAKYAGSVTGVDIAVILERLQSERDGSRESAARFEAEGKTYSGDIARAHAWAFGLAIDIIINGDA